MRCAYHIVFLSLAALGCSSTASRPAVVPVSGRVMMDGKPLPKAMVRFQPLGHEKTDPKLRPDSYGTTDEQGYFILTPIVDDPTLKGALDGKHAVQISIFDREAPTGPRELVPAKYNRDSKLMFTVPADGTKEANFNLTSK